MEALFIIVLAYIAALFLVGALCGFMARATGTIRISDAPAPNGEGNYSYDSRG